MSKFPRFLATSVVVAWSASTAMAVSIGYTVTDVAPTSYPGPFAPPAGAPHLIDGLGYAGDSVALASYSDTLDLTPGTYVQKINTLNWSVSYTYNGTDSSLLNDSPDDGDWPDLNFAISAIRSMSFGGGPAGSLGQSGLLQSTWNDDYLSLDGGPTSTFFVPGYQIDVTPLALGVANVTNAPGYPGGTPWIQPDRDVLAQFVVTAVPEPASLSFLTLGVIGLLRRRRTA